MSNPTGIVYLLDDELGMVKAVTRLLRARGFEVHGLRRQPAFSRLTVRNQTVA